MSTHSGPTPELRSLPQRKRKANEDPRTLLDPSSKEYMLAPGRIQSYMRAPRDVVARRRKIARMAIVLVSA